ncbi:MAG: hypothetical protein ABW217_03890 [Polyangiaceae bacterium]
MQAYRSKVVTIHAVQFSGYPDEHDEIHTGPDGAHFVKTLEGPLAIKAGDWLIQGTEGEFYPCKDSVFQRKYELA